MHFECLEVNINIEETFHTNDIKRDNFLSRVFGIFNEEIVRIWCKNENSRYEDLGRPSLYVNNKYTHTTLDFALRDRNGNIFLAEQKCELAYQNYGFIRLNSIHQLERHDKPAFEKFLTVATNQNVYEVKIKKVLHQISGSILIWGCVDENAKKEIMNHYNLSDILSIEDIINDLIKWDDENYKEFIKSRYDWIKELMLNLYGDKHF